MHFSTIFAAMGAAALFASASAGPIEARGMTAAEVVIHIDVITSKSQDLQPIVGSINLVNAALAIIGQGPIPEVITRFKKIISTVQANISAMKGTKPFKVEQDRKDVVKALKTFVKVHQALLNILIGKRGIIQQILFGPPIAAVLRSLEEVVVDTFAFALIDLLDSEAAAATTQKDSLDGTIQIAIQSFVDI